MSYNTGNVSTFENRMHAGATTQSALDSYVTEGNGYLASGTAVIPYNISGKWEREARKRKVLFTNVQTYWTGQMFGGAGGGGGGAAGNSLLFDGSSDFVEIVGTSIQPTAITVSAWFKNTGNFGGFRDICCKAGAGGYSFALQINTSDMAEFWISEDGSVLHSVMSTGFFTAANSGQFFHVAASYDGAGNFALYVNGALEGSDGIPTDVIFPSSEDVFIGKFGPATDYFQGIITSVRLYNSALTAGQVAQIYNDRLGAPTLTAGLLFYHNFSGTAGSSAVGQTVTDASAAHNNGAGSGNGGTLTYQTVSIP